MAPTEVPASALIVSGLLMLSGASALTYQIVWLRELKLIFGATTMASAAVLAVFMAGIGVGNLFFGKRVDLSVAPIRFYARLELAIAIWVAFTPWLIDLVTAGYIWCGGQATLGPGLAQFARLAGTAFVLFGPTFLMGGTIPAAAKAVSGTDDPDRLRLAWVYGLNTIGAVGGAFFSAFYLLEWFGNRNLVWLATTLNIIVALLALAYTKKLSSRVRPVKSSAHPSRPAASREMPGEAPTGDAPEFAMVCLASCTVGFVFFLMELVWYRMLGPLLGGTTYTFGIILCSALLGIGLGGAAYSLLGRKWKPTLGFLALTCCFEALALIVPFCIGDGVALYVLHQQAIPVVDFAEQIWRWSLVASLVIVPAAIIAGFQFPLMISLAGVGRTNVGKHVGWTFASNTVGAIGGSLAGGFLLMPLLSAPGLWRLSVAVLLSLAAACLIGWSRRNRNWVLATVAVGVLAFLGLFAAGPSACWRHAGIGAGRAILEGIDPNSDQEFVNRCNRVVIWEAEGIESSMAITATDGLAFVINGKSDGNAYEDAGTQIGLGLLGPLVHESPQSALVIGLGTGESAGWLASTQKVQQVDVVELEPNVVEMARRCKNLNQGLLENPKFKLHVNDAREYLLTAPEQYDLVVSEPSNPYRAGIANLYTVDFYSAVRQRLKSDGLFLQWLQAYEIDPETVFIVMATIRESFPNVQLWQTKARDLVFVCGDSSALEKLSVDQLQRRLEDPNLGMGLRSAWRIDDVEGVLAHHICSEKTIDDLLSQTSRTVNTDSHNYLEYSFAKSLGTSARRFDASAMYQRAMELNDHLPSSTIPFVNEALLRQRRIAMYVHLGQTVPDEAQSRPELANRVNAYNAYLAQQYPDALRWFDGVEIDGSCPIERTIFAHVQAENAIQVDAPLLDRIGAFCPPEEHALNVVHAARIGDIDGLLKHLDLYIDASRTNAWSMNRLMRAPLMAAASIAESNPAVARVLFDGLQEPFADYRLDEDRTLIRYFVADSLGSEPAIEALGALEPFVPWKGWVLENRWKLYSAAGNPLADRARKDLEKFKRHSSLR